MCVMCSTSVPTLFQYFFYDHIPTFLYIFHEMFFITCHHTSHCADDVVAVRSLDTDRFESAIREAVVQGD